MFKGTLKWVIKHCGDGFTLKKVHHDWRYQNLKGKGHPPYNLVWKVSEISKLQKKIQKNLLHFIKIQAIHNSCSDSLFAESTARQHRSFLLFVAYHKCTLIKSIPVHRRPKKWEGNVVSRLCLLFCPQASSCDHRRPAQTCWQLGHYPNLNPNPSRECSNLLTSESGQLAFYWKVFLLVINWVFEIRCSFGSTSYFVLTWGKSEDHKPNLRNQTSVSTGKP